MKTLNDKARDIFCQLIEKMDNSAFLRIENAPLMPIAIENLNQSVSTVFGKGVTFSLTQYYKENGDIVRYPEMCFIIVDERQTIDDSTELVKIIPYSLENDLFNLKQESVTIINSATTYVDQKLQFEHKLFADYWLVNIQDTNYL